jgi:hypothetical protein
MTNKEALAILGVANPDEFEDAFEERLFELKQYFLTKPLISKLYRSQSEKIVHLCQAAYHFGLEIHQDSLVVSEQWGGFTGEIVHDYLAFEKHRSSFKERLMKTSDGGRIAQLVDQLLKIQEEYLALWPEIKGEGVILGKEPDPMELLSGIKELQKIGIYRFEQLNNQMLEIPSVLLNEWKRLSLLSKKDAEWKMSSGN